MLKSLPSQIRPQIRRQSSYVAPGTASALQKKGSIKLNFRYVRPAVYHKFEQTVELSDGSTIKRKSVYPKSEMRMLQDQRSAPIWNPSKPNLKLQLAKDNSKLAVFRKKFGGLGDQASESGSFDLDDILSSDSAQVTTGSLEELKAKTKKRR